MSGASETTVATPEPGRRSLAFVLTWVAYATYYLGRKGFSVAKARMQDELGLSTLALGNIDTAYLAAYAAGQFGSGLVGDRVGARRLVGWGMLVSAGACLAFGLGHGALWFGACFLVNGLSQSTGWPGTNKVMAAWTTRADRGRIMGVWSTCYQVGGIAATTLAAWLLDHRGFRAAFTVPAIAVAAVGLVVLFFLPQRPERPRRPELPGSGSTSSSDNAIDKAAVEEARRRVVRDPLLWCYGVAYFCLKLIRYSLLFWLPFYLGKVVGLAGGTAGYVSISFEVGGIVGSVVIGFWSDRVRRVPRPLFAATFITGLAVALFAYGNIGPRSIAANAIILAAIGFMLFGPDSLLSGAAAQDAGGPHAAATAAGIVNGIGSVGAVLQGTITVGVSRAFGWDALFYAFVGLALVAAVALVPTFARRRAVADRVT